MLEEGGAELTVCFIDIVGYTARSRGLEGSELVSWVEQFEQETTLLVVDHSGQVIKTIGDEILFTVCAPAAAVEIALALTARGADPDDPFPAVPVGIAHDASDLRWRKLRRVSAKGFTHLDAWRVKAPRGPS